MEKSRLKQRLRELGVWEFLAWKRELQPLASLLRDDEDLLAVTSGVVKSQRWVVAVTGGRLLFVRASLIGGAEAFEIAPADILSCEGKRGWFFGSIRLEVRAGQADEDGIPLIGDGSHTLLDLRNVPKGTVAQVVKAVAGLSEERRS